MKSRANASNIKIRDRRKLIEGGLGSGSHNMPSHNIPGGKGVRDSLLIIAPTLFNISI